NTEDTTISDIARKEATAQQGKGKKRTQKHSLPILSKETYPKIPDQVTNTEELFELQRNLELPGKDFSQGNAFLSGEDFLEMINYVFRKYNALNSNSIPDEALQPFSKTKEKARATLHDFSRRGHTFSEINRPPLIIPSKGRSARVNPLIAESTTIQYAIILAYCDENHTTTTYYRLIWYPKDEKYTFTNLMVYITRLYTRAHVIGLQPKENVAATMKFFQEVLESTSSIICGTEVPGDHKVVWLV
ncbi:hypothetical protein IWQ62_006621, partial [Dispira parvispora]